MADYVGLFDPALSTAVGASGSRYLVGPTSTNVPGTRQLPANAVDTGWLLAASAALAGPADITGEGDVSVPGVTYAGVLDPGPHEHWFEHLLALPASIALGNLLTTVLRDLEIYSSYRRLTVNLTAAVNNAGAGISFVGLPSLPLTLGFNSGISFQVQATMQGPSVIDGTLDFTLSLGFVSVPITGARVVMLPYEPEAPIIEVLEFLTNVIEATDGTEQRIALRKNPRQTMQLRFMVEDAHVRRTLEALLYNWQAQVFGVPVWFEARYLGADAGIGSPTITVNTEFADFRVGGLCILWDGEATFESLEIQSKTTSSLTFSSDTTLAHTAGRTLVMPLRVGIIKENVSIARRAVGLDEVALRVFIADNDANLASTAAFGTHNSKVLLDEPNLMSGETINFSFRRVLQELDNLVGMQVQFSDWATPQVLHEKGFLFSTPERLWQVRQLMHALRGNQVSFYLPTYYQDLNIVQPLTASQLVVDIENIRYTEYIQSLEPLKSIRVELVDGTVLVRRVLSSAVMSATVERLTVDVAWPATVQVNEILRTSFVLLCRVADDLVTITHQRPGEGNVTLSVVGVKQ